MGKGIKSDGSGITINDYYEGHEENFNPNFSNTTVVINDDVEAKEYGLDANTPFTSTVVIDGALSGGKAAVVLGPSVTMGSEENDTKRLKSTMFGFL